MSGLDSTAPGHDGDDVYLVDDSGHPMADDAGNPIRYGPMEGHDGDDVSLVDDSGPIRYGSMEVSVEETETADQLNRQPTVVDQVRDMFGAEAAMDAARVELFGPSRRMRANAQSLNAAYWDNYATPMMRLGEAVDADPEDAARNLVHQIDDDVMERMVRIWLQEHQRLHVGVSHTSGQNVYHIDDGGNVVRLAGCVDGLAADVLRNLLYGPDESDIVEDRTD